MNRMVSWNSSGCDCPRRLAAALGLAFGPALGLAFALALAFGTGGLAGGGGCKLAPAPRPRTAAMGSSESDDGLKDSNSLAESDSIAIAKGTDLESIAYGLLKKGSLQNLSAKMALHVCNVLVNTDALCFASLATKCNAGAKS